MQFFYVSEKIDYIAVEGDIQCQLWFLPPEKGQIEAGQIDPDRLYFASDLMLQKIIGRLRQINRTKVISVVSEKSREELFAHPQFPVHIGGRCDNSVASVHPDEKIRALKKKDSIRAAIFAGNDSPDNAGHFSAGMDMLYSRLSAIFRRIEIDVYCHHMPRDFSSYLSVGAVLNIYQMPAGMNKLMQYDLYADFTGTKEDQDLRDELECFLEVMNFPALAAEDDVEGVSERAGTVCRLPEDLVSVVIPTFNRSGFLRQAIESVLNQTYRKLELLVVDDGSSDNTKTVIEHYAKQDLRVRYLQQENTGVSAARNRGISSSCGDYLFFLDDDDMLLPYALQKMLSFLKLQNDDIKLVYGDAFFYNQNKSRKVLSDLPSFADKPGLYLQFLRGDPILSVFVLVEKKAVLEAGMFDPHFRFCQDYELWMKILIRHTIAKQRIPVALYRVHEAQSVKDRALVRYYSDSVAFKMLQAIKPEDLFPEKTQKEELADALEGLARSVLRTKTAFPHFDTSLEILRLAQKEHPEERRQTYIEYLEREIPVILRNEFKCELRATHGSPATVF